MPMEGIIINASGDDDSNNSSHSSNNKNATLSHGKKM